MLVPLIQLEFYEMIGYTTVFHVGRGYRYDVGAIGWLKIFWKEELNVNRILVN